MSPILTIELEAYVSMQGAICVLGLLIFEIESLIDVLNALRIIMLELRFIQNGNTKVIFSNIGESWHHELVSEIVSELDIKRKSKGWLEVTVREQRTSCEC